MKTLLALTVLITSCKLGEAPAPTVVCNEQHAWADYHLPDASLKPVVVNRSGYTPELEPWNDLGTPVTLRSSGSGFLIVVEEGGDRDSGWLGLASITQLDGHIKTGKVTMNRELLKQYPPNVAAHVLCQEIGHILGLGHQAFANNSCMDDCQGRGPGWLSCLSSTEGTTPNAHDKEQLDTIYAHTDGLRPPARGCSGQILLHEFSATDSGHSHGEE